MTCFRFGHQGDRPFTSGPLVLAATAVLLALPPPTRGQEADELVEVEDTSPRSAIVAQGGFVYQGEADIDEGGDLQVFRYDLGVVGRTDLTDQLLWTNTFFFGANDYDFGGGISSGEPWETILNLRLATTMTYMFTAQWGASAGGIFTFSPETGADWGDSFTGGGLLAAEYRHSETLTASVGVAVVSQIEDDVRVVPAVRVNWLPDEHWAVRVGSVPASGGAAAAGEVAYRIIDPVELGLGVLYQQRRFRLDDSGLVPDGVGEDNSLPLRLRVGWNITPLIALNFLGGVALGGEVEVEDRDGDRLAKSDYDPAAYVGVRLLGGF